MQKGPAMQGRVRSVDSSYSDDDPQKGDSNVYMSKVHMITGSNGWILGYLADHENEEIYQKDIEEKFCVTGQRFPKC